MTGILFPSSIAMNTLAPDGHITSTGGPAKGAQVSKRKEREDDAERVGVTQKGSDVSAPPPTSPSTAAGPSTKRPKPSKSSSTEAGSLITGTRTSLCVPSYINLTPIIDIKLDLQKKSLMLIQDPLSLDKYTAYLSRTSPSPP